MQDPRELEQPGLYVAEWGGYRIGITVAPPRAVLMVIEDSEAPFTERWRAQRQTTEAAITSAADWLMKQGSSAFVDGRRRDVADFLSFKRNGMRLV